MKSVKCEPGGGGELSEYEWQIPAVPLMRRWAEGELSARGNPQYTTPGGQAVWAWYLIDITILQLPYNI